MSGITHSHTAEPQLSPSLIYCVCIDRCYFQYPCSAISKHCEQKVQPSVACTPTGITLPAELNKRSWPSFCTAFIAYRNRSGRYKGSVLLGSRTGAQHMSCR